MTSEIDRLALALVDASCEPAPTNLRMPLGRLQDQVGGLRVRKAKMRGTGCTTFPDPNTGIRDIFVNEADPATRMRFTIAHEIGHLVFERDKVVAPDVEEWCDEFANALLVPRTRLLEFSNRCRSVADWKSGPDKFWVSPEVFWRAAWRHAGVTHVSRRGREIVSYSIRYIHPTTVARLADWCLGTAAARPDCGDLQFDDISPDLFGEWEGILRQRRRSEMLFAAE